MFLQVLWNVSRENIQNDWKNRKSIVTWGWFQNKKYVYGLYRQTNLMPPILDRMIRKCLLQRCSSDKIYLWAPYCLQLLFRLDVVAELLSQSTTNSTSRMNFKESCFLIIIWVYSFVVSIRLRLSRKLAQSAGGERTSERPSSCLCMSVCMTLQSLRCPVN